MRAIDIIVSAVDNASKIIEGIGDTSAKAAEKIEKNWLKVTLAAGAAGVALEALGRKQFALSEQTKKVAASIDVQENKIRDLAIALSDVSIPLEDVLALMELGRQQGLRSTEQLSDYVNYWKMVSNATGEASTSLAEASIALRAVGIATGDEEDALAAFGYILQETTSDVSYFLQFLLRTGPQLREMGADINDAAAILGILEHEFGLVGRQGIAQFRQAVSEANGDLEKMLSTLGISVDLFDEYRNAVAESNDVIERNAELNEESYTVMQKLQHWASELTYKYGDLIEVLSQLSTILVVIGPLFKGIAVAKSLLATAMGKLTLSSSTLLSTIGSIGGVATLAVAGTTALGMGVDWLSEKVDKAYAPLVRLLYPFSEFIHLTKLYISVFKGLKEGTIDLSDLFRMTRVELETWAETGFKGFGGSGETGVGAGGTWQYGGRIPGPVGMPRLAMVHGGEEITNPFLGQTSQMAGNKIIIENKFVMDNVTIREKADIDELAEGFAIKVSQKLAGMGFKW